jgi:hypothetical protein
MAYRPRSLARILLPPAQAPYLFTLRERPRSHPLAVVCVDQPIEPANAVVAVDTLVHADVTLIDHHTHRHSPTATKFSAPNQRIISGPLSSISFASGGPTTITAGTLGFTAAGSASIGATNALSVASVGVCSDLCSTACSLSTLVALIPPLLLPLLS